MESLSVFKFSRVADFLKVLSSQHSIEGLGKPSTAEAWARELGYNSAQTVSMVLSGVRAPSVGLTKRLGQKLGLNSQQKRYLELIGELERRTRSEHAVTDLMQEIREMNPSFGQRQPLDAARFSYIADWYHFAIKQLASAPGFREDPEWICERLRYKLTIKEAETALETMLRVGVLRRDPESRKIATAGPLQSSSDIPSSALRSHHKQMMERATEALEEQDVKQREVTALTFRFNKKKMEEAKQAIRRFRDWFDAEFEDADSTDVYQLNMQFFSHSQQEDESL